MNPVKTLCFTFSLVVLLAVSAVAQNRTLYFYPPEDAKWISGRSYIYDLDNSPKPLTLAKNRCGWYEITLSAGDPLLENAQIWLGKSGIDKICPTGRQKDPNYQGDPNSDFNRCKFKLDEIFKSWNNRSELWLMADGIDPDDSRSGWFDRDPGDGAKSRCEFRIAAYIYDTDKSVNPSFEEYEKDRTDGTGIITGMVEKTLDPKTKKIKCDNCTKPVNAGGFKTKEQFEWAFHDYKKGDRDVKNVKLCYDMPFEQKPSGSFEFDSDSLKNNSSKLVGGFFPELLDNRALGESKVVEGAADYSACPDCRTKRKAESFVNLKSGINPWCFNRGYKTGSNPTCTATIDQPISTCCGSAYGDGDFINGDTPANTWGATPNGDWNNTWRQAQINLWGGSSTGDKAEANEHFCFESHATFIYDPEQEFLFRGDDDIWVYIDNKLVIDLGGTHLAAPGSVRLKDIKPSLEAGKTYDIDIFFCDRRTTMSNVRISTNMYVSQSIKFTAVPENPNLLMCAEIAGGSDCGGGSGETEEYCGPPLMNDKKYTVDFFMWRKSDITDTTWLSATNTKDCKVVNGLVNCFGTGTNGIVIDKAVYQCGGAPKCQGRSHNVQVTGNVQVGVLLRDPNGIVVGSIPSIDQFRTDSHLSMVWGNLVGNEPPYGSLDLEDAYGGKTKREQWIIAGKRTPIYISSGEWSGNDKSYTTFEYDNPVGGTSVAAGQSYNVTGDGVGLKIYASKIGTEEKKSGTLPASGIDTLWVEGSYSIGGAAGEAEFSLNVVAESDKSPSLKLHVYQPKLEFREKDYSTLKGGSDGFLRWIANGETKPPYVGAPLAMNIVAVDWKRNNEICEHCSFTLTQASTTNCNKINSIWRELIVKSEDANKMPNGGKLAFNISGSDLVEKEDGAICKAEWTVFGPNTEFTFARWTGLQFILAPVPMPRTSFVFDTNGDGIADSIRIEFTKSFKDEKTGAVVDSLLPLLLELVWAKGDTVRFHHSDFTLANLKTKKWVEDNYRSGTSFSAKNAEYWKKFVKGDSLLIITQRETDIPFSKDIQTSGYKEGKGDLGSYTPFFEDETFQYEPKGVWSFVQDRVSPIVVKAVYKYSAKNASDCLTSTTGCYEQLEVQLSEPVFQAENATSELIRNPFSYCLGFSQGARDCAKEEIKEDSERFSLGYDNNGWEWDLPPINTNDASASAIYSPTTRRDGQMAFFGSGKGDSIVNLAYYRKAVSGDQTNRVPKSSDWVKIRHLNSVFLDADSNGVNTRERGVLIVGAKAASKKQIKISTVNPDPNAPVLGGAFESSENLPPWFPPGIIGDIKKGGKNELFKGPSSPNAADGNIAEMLPIPRELEGKQLDSMIRVYFPGSVGSVFLVNDKIREEVRLLDSACAAASVECKINGKPLASNAAAGITIFGSANYHTNLGNYVAHRNNLRVDCTADIFKGADGSGNCLDPGSNFYLAWNLRANTGRLVGAGAYVGISRFYWQIEYERAGKKIIKKYNQDEFIEMYGVKRGK